MTCHVSDILDKCSAYSDNKWVSIRYLLPFFFNRKQAECCAPQRSSRGSWWKHHIRVEWWLTFLRFIQATDVNIIFPSCFKYAFSLSWGLTGTISIMSCHCNIFFCTWQENQPQLFMSTWSEMHFYFADFLRFGLRYVWMEWESCIALCLLCLVDCHRTSY